MTFSSGTRLGPYEIIARIGAGGMGEVYTARDTRLDRMVAVKVLLPHVASDPDLRQRFEREARAVAALNHPHICTLHDVGRQDGTDYLVMEYLEGETLAARLTKGPLPVEQALQYAIQIADAIDKAHRRGITHRDLKPLNVMLTKSGAKLLDFGLAKLRPAATVAGMDAVDTMQPAVDVARGGLLTGRGAILGTLQYMAPEQVEGKDADSRTDIFAFGVVLYEMLTGKRAFEGRSPASLIAAILDRDPPPVSALQPLTSPALDHLVTRCLAKDPDERWQSAKDLREDLRWIADAGSRTDGASPVAAPRRGRERVAWSAAVLVLAVALAGVAYRGRGAAPSDQPETRLELSTPGGNLTFFAMAPDGRALVYVATVDGKTQLWLRPLDRESAQPLPGTEDAFSPFWSPDSRSVAFFVLGQLKRIDLASGFVRTVSSASGASGAWSRGGLILFSPDTSGSLFRVPAGGGTAVEAIHLDPTRQTMSFGPNMLPDDRHFLAYVHGIPEATGIHVGSLDSTAIRHLFAADEGSVAMFSPPDWVLFARQGVLLAQRLDLEALLAVGDPVVVAPRVANDPGMPSVALSASPSGPVAYRASAGERQLIWLDRSGRQIGTLGGPDDGQPGEIRLSPDASVVAIRRSVAGNQDVWLMDAARGVRTRFTTDRAGDYNPVWSPDGRRIVFDSWRTGIQDLYMKPVAGDEKDSLVLASPEYKFPLDWSRDGRFILYDSSGATTGRDLWVLPLDGDRKPVPVVQTPFNEWTGRFSPDGHWIAYESDASGQAEIYVQPFPGPGGKVQISTAGGTYPVWPRDGRELFFLANGRVMAAPVTRNGAGVGTPVALFTAPPAASTFDVTADGQRFLFNIVVKEASPITVLMHWKPTPRETR